MGNSYDEQVRKGMVYSPSYHPPAGTHAALQRDRIEADRKRVEEQRAADAERMRQHHADLESRREADRAREKRAAAQAKGPATGAAKSNAPERVPAGATITKTNRVRKSGSYPAKAPGLLVFAVAIVLAGTVWYVTSGTTMTLEVRLPITVASCVLAPMLARWLALLVYVIVQVIKWTLVLGTLAGIGYFMITVAM